MTTTLLLALVGPANAWESPPQYLLLQDDADVFAPVEFDSGWLPADSPVSVAFRITADGGAMTEMEGESDLFWPEPLSQQYVPWAGTGLFVMDSELTASVDFKFDVFGYQWED